jgi:hypothetical protein
MSVAAFELRVSNRVIELAVVLPVDMTLKFPRGFANDVENVQRALDEIYPSVPSPMSEEKSCGVEITLMVPEDT